MKNTLVLTKSLLINSFSLNSLKPKNFKLKNLWILLILVIASPSFYFMYQAFCKFVHNLAGAFSMIGQHGYLVGLAYNLVSVIILLFGLIQISSIFYYSNDIESLLVLPLRSRQVVFAKFFIVYLQELIFALLLLVPVFISIGLVNEFGIIYYLYSTLAILVAPILPLAISGIVMMVVMRVTSLSAKKDLFRVVSMFLVLGLYLGFNFFLTSQISNMDGTQDPNFMMNLLSDNQSLLRILAQINPLAMWLGVSVLGASNSLVSGLLYVGANLGIYLILMAVAEALYIGGIINGRDVSSKKKVLSDAEYDKNLSLSLKPYLAFAKVDLITILKTPVYLLNCVSIIVLLPVIYGIMFFVGDSGIPELLENIPLDNHGLIVLVLAGSLMFMNVVNPTASTTWSRMGKNFWLARIAPLSGKEHVIARLTVPLLLSVISGLMVGGIMFVLLDISIIFVLLGIVVGIIGSLPLLVLGIIVDTLRPLLEWDNPQRAVKNNLNVIVSMVVGVALVAGTGFLTFKLLPTFDGMILVLAYSIFYGVLTLIMFKIADKLITDRFQTLE